MKIILHKGLNWHIKFSRHGSQGALKTREHVRHRAQVVQQIREHVRHESTYGTELCKKRIRWGTWHLGHETHEAEQQLGHERKKQRVRHELREVQEHKGYKSREAQDQLGHETDEAREQVEHKERRASEHTEYVIWQIPFAVGTSSSFFPTIRLKLYWWLLI